MMLLIPRACVILAAGLAIFSLLLNGDIWTPPMPYPCTTQRVMKLPADKIPGPPMALEGAMAPNRLLKDRSVSGLFSDLVHGSECVAPGPGPSSVTMIDRQGFVWIADVDPGARGGYSMRPGGARAYLGPGRPLGFKYDAKGNLIICDSLKGLTMLEGGDGARLVVLANRVSPSTEVDPGSPIVYANALDISSSGVVYFSDSQNITTALNNAGFYDTLGSFMLGLFAGIPSGRLLSYDPSSGITRVVTRGFWYSNGVALSADESFVAVAETNCFAVRRVWLAGPKAGQVDTLIDALPGFPDGVTRSADGNFWVAIIAPRPPIVPLLRYTVLRAIMPWIPVWLRPKILPQGLVIKVSPSGEILTSLWDVEGDVVSGVSSVEEHEGRLWLGNLKGSGVGVYNVQPED